MKKPAKKRTKKHISHSLYWHDKDSKNHGESIHDPVCPSWVCDSAMHPLSAGDEIRINDRVMIVTKVDATFTTYGGATRIERMNIEAMEGC